MGSVPKQDTINKWCNPEAITALAERLEARADRLSPMFAKVETTEFCNPACHHDEDRNDAVTLRAAASALRAAASDADFATRQANSRALDRAFADVA